MKDIFKRISALFVFTAVLFLLTACGLEFLPDAVTDSGLQIVTSADTKAAVITDTVTDEITEQETAAYTIAEDGVYTSKDNVALYIHVYGKLPSNFITKEEAQKLGWSGGGLEKYAKGKCIGGDYFGNYEGKLPKKQGRKYYECDIDTLGADSRGSKRIVFSNDGLIFYTEDHFESFEQIRFK